VGPGPSDDDVFMHITVLLRFSFVCLQVGYEILRET